MQEQGEEEMEGPFINKRMRRWDELMESRTVVEGDR